MGFSKLHGHRGCESDLGMVRRRQGSRADGGLQGLAVRAPAGRDRSGCSGGAFTVVAGTPASFADEDVVRSIELPVLQAGRLLLKAGKPDDARTILEKMQPADENERIERLFLLGLAEAQLGLLSEAAERFETILASRPNLTRVRLELARVYFQLGRDEKARFHFEASKADELPSTVENAVGRFLREIDARKRWSFSISGAVLPESNPVKRTGDREVLIGGIPFQLDEDARESSGVGFLVSAGGSFSPYVTEGWRGVLALSSASKIYRRSAWNDIVIQEKSGWRDCSTGERPPEAFVLGSDGLEATATAGKSDRGRAAG